MATIKKMVKKGGKMVRAFAVDRKGKMKMGGSKKPLRKAQDGISMGPTRGTDVPPSITKAGVKVYSGPLTERDTKALDAAYPSTVGKTPKMEGRGSYSPKAVESGKRSLDENYLRSGNSTVQKWNANQSYPGENYPQSNSTNYKKGGAMKKMKTGGMVNSNSTVQAIKAAGSKGVKSGVNTKVSASTTAKGRTGGTSSAPKSAIPKAKMGMSMKSKKSC